jgi:hypothetical protein
MREFRSVLCRFLPVILFVLLAWPALVSGQDDSKDFDELSKQATAARVEGNNRKAIEYYEGALKIRARMA